jgi:4'-phosphopantetheinyl transferase EntD
MCAKDSIMDSQSLLFAWRTLLPMGVFVSAGPRLDDSVPLTERERASAGSVDEERLRELECGRVYAKRALAMIGFHGVELLVGPDRSPQWPAGVVGSLTHVNGCDGGHFAAAVARADTFCAVGIDVERERGLHPGMWEYVLTTHELERILALPVPKRAIEAQVAWCAKEAAGKAALRPIEPAELDIENNPDGEFTATWRPVIGGVTHSAHIGHGRTTRSQGFILAAVILPRQKREFESFN